MSDYVQNNLAAAECHFKWKPEQENIMPDDILLLEEKLLSNIKENHRIEIFALLLLSYIFAKGNYRGKNTDFSKAIKFADEALSTSTSKGDKYVATANKMHICQQRRDTTQLKKLHEDIVQYQEDLTKEDKCRIDLIHAFALQKFGIKSSSRAANLYRTILQELNGQCPDAQFGLGMVLGRIRRFNYGNRSKPSQEELDVLKKACDLFENQYAYPVVWYGYANAQYLTYDGQIRQYTFWETNRKYITDTAELFDKAVSLAKTDDKVGSSIVYKWCAKGYKILCKIKLPSYLYKRYRAKQKEYVDKAVESNPNDTSILHEAGLFYWRSSIPKDFDLAEKYLKEACEYGLSGNFWADIDLIKFQKIERGSSDSVQEYVKLLTKYADRQPDMARLHMFIGDELLENGNTDETLTDYMHALELDKTAKVERAKMKSIYILNRKLTEKTCNRVHLITQLGQVYYITREFASAKQQYEEILSVDSSNKIAQERLCEIHFELGEYDNCIQRGSTLLDRFPGTDIKDFVARSYFRVAMPVLDSNSETAEENLHNSAELGLLDAGQTLLDILEKHCKMTKNLPFTRTAYEQCAKLYGWYKRSDEHYSCEKPNETCDVLKWRAGQISKAAEELALVPLADLHPDMKENAEKTRRLCFFMTVKEVMPQHIEISKRVDVLDQAKCQLDGCFFTLKGNRTEFCTTTKRGYYPFTPKPKPNDPEPTESEENLKETSTFLKQKLETDMKLVNFSTILPDLFDFLCKRQARYSTKYNFVPEFCRIVNEKKHENRRDGLDDLYGLAHFACFHAEELAIELSKYMSPI